MKNKFENDEWFTTEEAAKYMKLSDGQLRNLISMGKVLYYKLGSSNRYKKSELDQLLNSEPRGNRNGYQARREDDDV